jgi:membrane peptidoglycan carboxypeptidase
MPRVTLLVRHRHKAHALRRVGSRWGGFGAGLLAGIALLVSGAGWVGARALDRLTTGLPPVELIEEVFGPAGEEQFPITRIYDRSGRHVLWRSIRSEASEARWLSLGSGTGPAVMASALPQAAVAGLDPSFWSGESVEGSFVEALGLAPARVAEGIEERLVRQTLLPLLEASPAEDPDPLIVAVQASRLRRTYSPERILEWFLNSVPFADDVYGVDAAARVFLGKPATALTLAESAWLVGWMRHGPMEDAPSARAAQVQVLQAMQEQGLISRAEARQAMTEEVAAAFPEKSDSGLAEGYVSQVLRVLRAGRPEGSGIRLGMTVVTALDMDLQLQVECTLQTQVRRLGGGGPDVVLPAADGSACVVAGLLPLLRPGDLGADHRVEAAAAVVLDSQSGQVLAFVGDASEASPTGPAFAPLVYLAAFSRGFSPATMVLDLPGRPGADLQTYQGPVRMRVGLAGALPGALQSTLAVADPAYVISVAQQMGVNGLAGVTSADIGGGTARASLLDVTYAYSVLADQGMMNGVAVPDRRRQVGLREVDPALILSIEGPGRLGEFAYSSTAQSVLGPSLAFLVADVLRDATARPGDIGAGASLDPGREAALIDGPSGDGRFHWTVGFAPPRVVGVWFRAPQDEQLIRVDSYNGPASVWKAVLQYATRDLAVLGFPRPAGVIELEVCDPSGLLPTPYCPRTVREVFLPGTEPVHYDHMFQPFRINRETGKLATLFTPLVLVEERTFLIPPPEAEAWARSVGFPQPPDEYDPLPERLPFDPEVNVESPAMLEIVRGRVAVRGNARMEDLASFRVQFGEGLNPTRWFSLGEPRPHPVRSGLLAEWDTQGRNGLVTLQLVAVGQDGSVRTAAVPVILDNEPPEVAVLLPASGERIRRSSGRLLIEAAAEDETGVDRVEFLLDGERVATLEEAPYSIRIPMPGLGEHRLVARCFDAAGNSFETEPLVFRVVD